MTAEEYYQTHSLVHGLSANVQSRDYSRLSSRPSEVEYALYWLQAERITGAILDVGCGPLSLLTGAEGMFTRREGVDIARCPNWDTEPDIRAQLCNLDEEPLPFAEDTFDAVTCLAVLEHVFDPFHAVRELRRVCKPAGRVVVGVPNVAGIKRRLELLRGKLPITSARFSFDEGAWDGFHLHNFTRASLDWLLRKEGLEPIRWASAGRFRVLKQWRPSLFGNDLVTVLKKVAPKPQRNFPF